MNAEPSEKRAQMVSNTLALAQNAGQLVIDPFVQQLHASQWIEQCAHALYQAERAQFPDRNLPDWDQANHHMRADARYRATAAHMRGNPTVKAALVERLAMTLALADGYVWPGLANRERPSPLPADQAAAMQAQRRQGYRHQARLVITAVHNYLDVDAPAEPEEIRSAILASAKVQQQADVASVNQWKQAQRRVVPFGEAITGDGRY